MRADRLDVHQRATDADCQALVVPAGTWTAEPPAKLRRRRRRGPVPAHDLADLLKIVRAAGARGQHVVDLTKVVGSHEPRTGDRQELRVLSAAVLESVDSPPGDAEGRRTPGRPASTPARTASAPPRRPRSRSRT